MAVSAIAGLLFWTLAARLTTSASVGLATAAVAGAGLVVSICELGLSTAVHFRVSQEDREAAAFAGAGIAAAAAVAAVSFILFLLIAPATSPGLTPLRSDPVLGAAFGGLIAANLALTFHDAIMLARQRPDFVFWRNSACNLPSVILLPLLVPLVGAERAILASFALPNVVVAIASEFVLLPRFLMGYRTMQRPKWAHLRALMGHSLPTHAANLLWSIATLALPLVAITWLSAAQTGHFYIGWTMLNLVLVVPRVVASSLYVQAVRAGQSLAVIVREAAVLVSVLTLPLCVAVWLAAPLALRLFGPDYAEHVPLRILLLSVPAFCVNCGALIILRAQVRLRAAIFLAAAIAATTLSLSSVFAARFGLTGLAWGWCAAQSLIAALVTVVAAGRTHRFRSSRAVAACLGAILAVAAVPGPVAARGPVPCIEAGLRAATPDAPPAIELRCRFHATGEANDTIVIVPRGQTARAARDWRDASLMADAVWIFDYRGDGRAELLIDFQTQGQVVSASLYDVPVGADRVEWRADAAGAYPRAGAAPSVRVVAPDGWWTRAGVTNLNLDVTVDGLIDAALSVRDRLRGIYVNDGFPDVVIHVRDRDRDGRPEMDWRTAQFRMPPPPLAATVPRTYLMVNARDDEAPLEPIFPWPLLGEHTFGYLTSSPHAVTSPPIQIDWATGQLTAVGEFVSSRGNDGQWFVYSFAPVEAGRLTTPNFESPFAWYDLGEDRDGQAELAIRLSYFPVGDPAAPWRGQAPLASVRYSWDQNNDGFWDYKLGLLGRHAVTGTVTLPEFTLQMVAPEVLPSWVAQREWGPAFFVASEQPGTVGEGIYVWDPPAELITGYFAGTTDTPPAEPSEGAAGVIPIGFRGDYYYRRIAQPTIYLSPVDWKLHLLDAEAGVWNLGDERFVRYEAHDSRHVNHWRIERGGTIEQALFHRVGQLVLTTSDEVLLRAATTQGSVFATTLPTTHREWSELSDRLAAVSRVPSARGDDLAALFNQFESAVTRVPASTLSDYRTTPEGFEFTLALEQAPPAEPPWLARLGAGVHRVRYTPQSGYSAEPARRAELQVNISLAGQSGNESHQPVPVDLTLRNLGDVALRAVPLVVGAGLRGGPEQQIESLLIDIPAQTEIVRRITWVPAAPGEWVVRVTSPLSAGVAAPLQIAPAQSADPSHLLAVQGVPQGLLIILGLLATSTVLAAGTLSYVLLGGGRIASQEPASGEDRIV